MRSIAQQFSSRARNIKYRERRTCTGYAMHQPVSYIFEMIEQNPLLQEPSIERIRLCHLNFKTRSIPASVATLVPEFKEKFDREHDESARAKIAQKNELGQVKLYSMIVSNHYILRYSLLFFFFFLQTNSQKNKILME